MKQVEMQHKELEHTVCLLSYRLHNYAAYLYSYGFCKSLKINYGARP